MRAAFRIFEGTDLSWEPVLRRAAEFAGRLGPERVISISHGETVRSARHVVVWFWEAVGEAEVDADA